jgi:hypothetical protein
VVLSRESYIRCVGNMGLDVESMSDGIGMPPDICLLSHRRCVGCAVAVNFIIVIAMPMLGVSGINNVLG